MANNILGVFKFSDEKIPMMTLFNTRRVVGLKLRKDESGITDIVVDLIFLKSLNNKTTSISIYPFPMQKMPKEKIFLLGQAISSLAFDNISNPILEEECHGVLIKPDNVDVYEDPKTDIGPSILIHIEKILAIELQLPTKEILIFVDEGKPKVTTLIWRFQDEASCVECFKTYLTKNITKLIIDMSE